MKFNGQSGQLYASNDALIEALLLDPYIRVFKDGTIETRRDIAGHVQDVWRKIFVHDRSGYKFIAYGPKKRRKKLAIHRIIYAKFKGKLHPELVINHIDGNPANNHPSNLELVTQKENMKQMLKTKSSKEA